MKTIMLFSGGADSAFIAYKLLTETNDELTLLTLINDPDSQVSWAPKQRFLIRYDKLISELEKIRNFTVIKKPVLASEIHVENDNVYLYAIEHVAEAMNTGVYDRFVTGRTWEQQNQSLFKNSDVKGTPTYFASRNLWSKLVTKGNMYDPLVDNSFYEGFSRWHIIKKLPANILKYTLSCHNPKINEEYTDAIECGVCYKCLWEQKTKEFIDKGYTAEQINAWRRLKSLEYGGGNNVSCPIRFWLPLEMGKGNILKYTKVNSDVIRLDSKEIIREILQTEEHYTYRDLPKSGIWDFSQILNRSQ